MARALLFLAAWFFVAPSFAAGGLAKGGSAVVAEVIDGDTVVLDHAIDGARQVRLVGIQAPKLALGRAGFSPWPLAGEAKRAVEALALGRRVGLAFGGRRRDRHGRLLAHLFREDGLWIQGALLERGLARVYSFADNVALVADMLGLERRARKARRGIWARSFYAVRTPAGAARDIGTFQLVEGRVLDAARVKGRVYLNFGPDWRTDFTVFIGPAALRAFRRAGVEPLALEGRTIRVRGWIRKRNGALIEATHAEQIEVLGE